jgi:hypothetical protein
MADKKISALSSATTPLAGSEVLPIVQSGTTVKVSVDNLTAGKDTSMKNLTYTGTLTGSTGIANIGSGQVYKDANGNVMLGNTAQIASSKFLVLNNETTANHVILASTRAYTDLPFARVQFAHKYDTGGTYVQFATVQGGKENANNADTAGYLSFSTFQNGGSLAERMRISSTGNITASTGNLVMGTADKGIDFSANSSAAGMTSELLNDYEEGTWTPVATARSGSITSYTSSGTYTKIGDRVFYSLQITLTDNGTGTVLIDVSLPFVVGAVSGGAGQNVNTAFGLSGSSGVGLANLALSRSDGAYPGVTGNTLRVFGNFRV